MAHAAGREMNVAFAFAFAALMLLGAPAPAPHVVGTQRDPLQGFDAYVQKSMAEWQVPGLAVAVIKNDQVVFLKGYGLREAGKGALVDERTVFPLASVSKSFTAAAIGLLVGEGKVSWDDRVIKHLPWLELRDSWIARELTLRDLLAHRMGDALGANAWAFEIFACGVTPDEILRRLRHLDPGPRRFRHRSAYDDVNYLLAGEVVAAASARRDTQSANRGRQPGAQAGARHPSVGTCLDVRVRLVPDRLSRTEDGRPLGSIIGVHRAVAGRESRCGDSHQSELRGLSQSPSRSAGHASVGCVCGRAPQGLER